MIVLSDESVGSIELGGFHLLRNIKLPHVLHDRPKELGMLFVKEFPP